jgi:hypothetical protein
LKRAKADGPEPARLYEFRQKETDDVLKLKRIKTDEAESSHSGSRYRFYEVFGHIVILVLQKKFDTKSTIEIYLSLMNI